MALREVLLASMAVAATACGASSDWSGLIGGEHVAATLPAPRQLSPLSVSFISSARPRLKWALAGDATGAVVELSQTRDFAVISHTFTANGVELVVPEDLTPGIWFWRLRGHIDLAAGTLMSPVWEMLVRGPAANGSSDAPYGGLLDDDGDGVPEVVIAAELEPQRDTFPDDIVGPPPDPDDPSIDDPPTVAGYVAYHWPSGSFTQVAGGFYEWEPGSSKARPQVSFAGGLDIDGDGFTNLVHTGLDFEQGGRNTLAYAYVVEYGDPSFNSFTHFLTERYLNWAPGQFPVAVAAGDFDGDGYADTVFSTTDATLAALGSVVGPYRLAPMFVMTPGRKNATLVGGFDADADGFGDVAFASPTDDDDVDLLAGMGGADYADGEANAFSDAPSTPDEAGCFAAGDFNGDGIADVAYLTAVDFCIWFGDTKHPLGGDPDCTDAPPGETLTGHAIGVDVEGDGLDELVFSTKKGGVTSLRIMHLDAHGLRVEALGDPGVGSQLTAVWPGRPGKARFAALSDDRSNIMLYEGTTLFQTVGAPANLVHRWARGMR